MLLFIEGYKYRLNCVVRDALTVRDVLGGIVTLHDLEQDYTPPYVGYCYSRAAEDVVFFLPKVVLTGETDEENRADTVFGASPEEIIDFDSAGLKDRFKEEGNGYKEFLSNLAIWIYRTIIVYKKHHGDNILEPKEIKTESAGRKSRHNTLLDVIIALIDFNKKNQDYLTFVARNMHTGYNKIQWSKTISRSEAIVQSGKPVYLNPVNKKKVVNFDEELLVIFYSILNYIHKEHGFGVNINLNYELISAKRLKAVYIGRKLGMRRLRQIKYKYFSDKALRIWDLCYAFFDRNYNIAINQNRQDFLLARDFDHVFEVMIDTLVSGEEKRNINDKLINQKDGKIVDHMFIGQGLIEQSSNAKDLTYYIGDSKYYKRGENHKVHLGDGSIYKQYTYARNVVQWNMNLFLGLERNGDNSQPQLFDQLTEGYNPIPNFFISAHIPTKGEGGEFLSFDDGTISTQEGNIQLNRQFENRLFDRDTLLLCHYDVNFLFIVSLYGRNNKGRQATWRDYVRKEFRNRIQQTLNSLYEFHILQPREGMDCESFIKNNFRELNGKIYQPKADGKCFVMALMKNDQQNLESLKILGKYTMQEIERQQPLIDSLKSHFHVTTLDKLPERLELPKIEDDNRAASALPASGDLVLCIMFDRLEDAIGKVERVEHIAQGLSLSASAMRLTQDFTKTKYVLLHNKRDYRIFKTNGSPRFASRKDIDEKTTIVKIKDQELYIVFDIHPEPLHDVEINTAALATAKGDDRISYYSTLIDFSKLL